MPVRSKSFENSPTQANTFLQNNNSKSKNGNRSSGFVREASIYKVKEGIYDDNIDS
jgi:hypothetical protein